MKKKPSKRFVPTVRQYQEDVTVLRAAGPNALLKTVLTRWGDPSDKADQVTFSNRTFGLAARDKRS